MVNGKLVSENYISSLVSRFINEVENVSSFLIDRFKKEGVVRSSGIGPYITDYSYMITGFTAAYPVYSVEELYERLIEAGILLQG